jgi:hypothetical protein
MYICGGLSNEDQELISTFDTAKDALEKLEKVYQKEDNLFT